MTPDSDASVTPWRKSVHSGANAGCVEVARLTGKRVGVRDSKDRAGSPVLSFRTHEWRSFLGTVKTGHLDLT